MRRNRILFSFIFFLWFFSVGFEVKAQFFYDESGKRDTGMFVLNGNASYTGKGYSLDPNGDDYIRLTSNATDGAPVSALRRYAKAALRPASVSMPLTRTIRSFRRGSYGNCLDNNKIIIFNTTT